MHSVTKTENDALKEHAAPSAWAIMPMKRAKLPSSKGQRRRRSGGSAGLKKKERRVPREGGIQQQQQQQHQGLGGPHVASWV